MRPMRNISTNNQKLTLFTLFWIALSVFSLQAIAGELEDKFSVSDQKSTMTVDHSVWDQLLQKYVVGDDKNFNSVNYSAFKKSGSADLKKYLSMLQSTDVTKLNKDEQFAFWANLYNAVTIDVILQHYPVKSIKDIDISGFFANGPWGKKLVKVNGTDLSLDDIEHKILRGIWKDPRVHYAVNCASIGCPNLAKEAFTGSKLQQQLNEGAKAYVNHPRGIAVSGKRVTASKIYSWFRKDFGTSEENILKHIRQYASADLKKKLAGINDISSYEYDWNLNDTKQ